jgi:hypothetical protein
VDVLDFAAGKPALADLRRETPGDPDAVRVDVTEVGRHQQVTPVSVPQFDRVSQPRQITPAQPQRGESKSLALAYDPVEQHSLGRLTIRGREQRLDVLSGSL